MNCKAILIVFASFFFSYIAKGQQFEITTSPFYDTTVGVTPYVPAPFASHAFVEMKTFVKNIGSAAIPVIWRSLSTDTTQNPEDWVLAGICDNILCRAEYGPWYYGEADTSAPIQSGSTMSLIVHIYAPAGTPDAVGTYKVELKTLDQSQVDTAVFILTKDESTGISLIPLEDKRVSIYPNPVSGSDLHVYIDQNLKAAKATIYSIIGREQISLSVAKNKDLTTFNVNDLPAGLYILRLTDDQGQTITSRKFSKR